MESGVARYTGRVTLLVRRGRVSPLLDHDPPTIRIGPPSLWCVIMEFTSTDMCRSRRHCTTGSTAPLGTSPIEQRIGSALDLKFRRRLPIRDSSNHEGLTAARRHVTPYRRFRTPMGFFQWAAGQEPIVCVEELLDRREDTCCSCLPHGCLCNGDQRGLRAWPDRPCLVAGDLKVEPMISSTSRKQGSHWPIHRPS